MIPRLVIASKNVDKLNEVKAIVSPYRIADELVEGLSWPDVEETGSTLQENALLKARAVTEATGLPALADDTGLEVEALGGLPGVRTSRFAGPNAGYAENVEHLLARMSGESNRRARFRTVVALVMSDGVEITAEGWVDGVIANSPRGLDGFGYDPVFEVDGLTLAEMSDAEKNVLSHRARAIHALARELGL